MDTMYERGNVMGTYCCIAQGTLLNALGVCPKWEGSPKGEGHEYMYG